MSHNNQFDDSQLEQILQKYGKSEPRAGLEQRVLAVLATKRAESTNQNWHWRLIVTTLAIGAIASAAIIVVRSPVSQNKILTNQTPITNVETSVASATTNRLPHRVPRLPQLPQHEAKTTAQPRLGQFPSPAPLNEQEEMLAQYVQSRHPEAVMIAKARAELEKQNLEQLRQTDSE
jgi:hypothetical protein